jgi:hypothetical protein
MWIQLVGLVSRWNFSSSFFTRGSFGSTGGGIGGIFISMLGVTIIKRFLVFSDCGRL